MSNAVELLVKIGIDTSKKADLQTEINNLGKSLEGLKVDIKFDKEAIRSLNDLAKMDFSKLTQSINSIKTDLKAISGEAKQTAKMTEDEFKKASKDIEDAFGHLGNNFKKVVKKGISHDIDDLKKAFAGLDASFKLDYKMLKNNGADTARREIDAVTVSYKNLQGQMETMKMRKVNIGDDTSSRPVFMPTLDGKAIDSTMAQISKLGTATQKSLDTMRMNGKLTEAQFKELSAEISKVGTVSGFDHLNEKIQETAYSQKILTQSVKAGQTAQNSLATSANTAIQKITKLRAEGKITDQQFAILADRIGKIGHTIGFSLLNQRIEETVNKQKKVVAAQKEQEQAQIRLANNELKRKNLIADIERALKNNARTINTLGAQKLIDDMKKADASAKNFGQTLKESRAQFSQLNREASDLARQNGGMMDSFKQAMTKFPIWMAASTLFYGVIRTAREFGSVIVDIDTKMVSLSKVLSEDADLEGLFDSATEAAGRLGQSISSVLDSFAEFARQGFKGDELTGLANAGLVASNVGEISAQEASEYMTASLIQWRKQADEGMSIIDSWNEISNNYATTVEKLAAGQARAGATARAMNLDFDQTNAIIGTVTASTKQSGREVGKHICPFAQRCA